MSDIGYRKSYKMRQVIPGKRHITVAIPYEVIERQATMHNLTVDEFVDQYVAVAEYNSFEGIHYTFQKAEG